MARIIALGIAAASLLICISGARVVSLGGQTAGRTDDRTAGATQTVELRFAWPKASSAMLEIDWLTAEGALVAKRKARVRVETVDGSVLEISTEVDTVTDGEISVPSEGTDPRKVGLAMLLTVPAIQANASGEFVGCGEIAKLDKSQLAAAEKYGADKKLLDVLRRAFAKPERAETARFEQLMRWDALRGPADGSYQIGKSREVTDTIAWAPGKTPIPRKERTTLVAEEQRGERRCLVIERDVLLSGSDLAFAMLGSSAVGILAGLDGAEYRVLTRIRAVHDALTMQPIEVDRSVFKGAIADPTAPNSAEFAQRFVERFEWHAIADER